MDPATAITLATAAVGAATSIFGGNKKRKAEKRLRQATIREGQVQRKIFKRQEKLRLTRLKRDASKARIRAIREGILARAQNLSSAAAAGSQFSSGLAGAQSSVTSQQSVQVGDVNASERSGEEFFQLNNELNASQTRLQAAGGRAATQVSKANSFVSIGNSLVSNSQTIGNLGADAVAGFDPIGA